MHWEKTRGFRLLLSCFKHRSEVHSIVILLLCIRLKDFVLFLCKLLLKSLILFLYELGAPQYIVDNDCKVYEHISSHQKYDNPSHFEPCLRVEHHKRKAQGKSVDDQV